MDRASRHSSAGARQLFDVGIDYRPGVSVQHILFGPPRCNFFEADEVGVDPYPVQLGTLGHFGGIHEHESVFLIVVPVSSPIPKRGIDDLRMKKERLHTHERLIRHQAGIDRGDAAVNGVHIKPPDTLLGQQSVRVRPAAPPGDRHPDPKFILPDLVDRSYLPDASRPRHHEPTLFLRSRDQRLPLGIEPHRRTGRWRGSVLRHRRGCRDRSRAGREQDCQHTHRHRCKMCVSSSHR